MIAHISLETIAEMNTEDRVESLKRLRKSVVRKTADGENMIKLLEFHLGDAIVAEIDADKR